MSCAPNLNQQALILKSLLSQAAVQVLPLALPALALKLSATTALQFMTDHGQNGVVAMTMRLLQDLKT